MTDVGFPKRLDEHLEGEFNHVCNRGLFFFQAESSDTMNLDTKLYNPTEPTTSTMYLNQSIELGQGSLDNKPVQVF